MYYPVTVKMFSPVTVRGQNGVDYTFDAIEGGTATVIFSSRVTPDAVSRLAYQATQCSNVVKNVRLIANENDYEPDVEKLAKMYGMKTDFWDNSSHQFAKKEC